MIMIMLIVNPELSQIMHNLSHRWTTSQFKAIYPYVCSWLESNWEGGKWRSEMRDVKLHIFSQLLLNFHSCFLPFHFLLPRTLWKYLILGLACDPVPCFFTRGIYYLCSTISIHLVSCVFFLLPGNGYQYSVLGVGMHVKKFCLFQMMFWLW